MLYYRYSKTLGHILYVVIKVISKFHSSKNYLTVCFCSSGKAWLVLVIFLRILVLLFAGYPLYQDEQERFVCNTIQPGCANVCYDMFAPLSLFRFLLVQLTTLCLPYVMFVTYVIHKVSSGLPAVTEKGRVQYFTGAYILHLLLRILVEAGFGAAHYYLFGFHVPKRFMCQQPPCTTMVDCYISRPTEKTIMLNFMLGAKTIMLNFMLGAAALSLLLNVCDLICAVKRSVRQKSKRKMLVEKMYAEEQYYLSGNGNRGVDASIPPTKDVMGPGGFRKRGTRNSSGDEAASVLLDDDPPPTSPLGGMPTIVGMPGSNNNDDSSSYQPTQEEGMEREGSEVALYPSEPLGTPRSIRVSKRSRLKPPPPPRRDKLAVQGAIDVSGATAVCTRRLGQYTLVEMTTGEDIPTCNGDGQEKRSEWV
uniref:Gap junction protein n=1 Tax=Sinocyclocheilus rhinocerous TaxID=307959 RepID=A0A673L5F2_9TELE